MEPWHYDLVILAILGFTAVRGAIRGFVWQLATIAALVLCFVFAQQFSHVLRPYVPVDPPLDRWIAMFVLYILFSLLAFLLARSVREWLERARLVEYDRHLGMLFGLIKGVAISLVVTFFLVTLSQQLRPLIFHSYSGRIAAVVMDRLHPILPDELHEVLEPYIHQLDRPGLDLHHSPRSRAPHHDPHHDHSDSEASDGWDIPLHSLFE